MAARNDKNKIWTRMILIRVSIVIVCFLTTAFAQVSYELSPESQACLAKFFSPASASTFSQSKHNFEIVRCTNPSKELCDVAAGIKSKNYSGVRCLLDAEFDFNLENGFLIYRAAYSDAEMLGLLFLSRITLNLESSDSEGLTILTRTMPRFRPGPLIHRYRSYSLDNIVRSTEILLEKGSGPNAVAKNGSSPLMFTSNAGEPKLVELLLRYGADPNFQSPEGKTALMVAYDDPATLKVLLASNTNIYLTDEHGKSAIFYAAEKCQINKAKLLLAKDQRIARMKDSAGKIPLDYLPKSSDCSSMKKLLRMAR